MGERRFGDEKMICGPGRSGIGSFSYLASGKGRQAAKGGFRMNQLATC
jgi:hypothetical protein